MNKVLDINNKLKLVVKNNKVKQKQRNARGKSAIEKLARYNEACRRLRTVEYDLMHNTISQGTHDYIEWFLNEFLEAEPTNDVEAVIFKWADYLLEYLNAGKAKIARKRTTKPVPPSNISA